jgi:osmotically-inducible protein OsmY
MLKRNNQAALVLGLCLLAAPFTGACRGGDEAANANAANRNATNTAVVVNTNTANTAASANDSAIRSSVEENLKKAGVTGVNVRVEGGVVYLTGTVPDANFMKANQAAQEANPKPTRVDNTGLKRG